MKVIVTTLTRSPRGNPMRASRELHAEQIRIGRGAECELRLADPRVPLLARTLFLGKSGPQLYDAYNPHVDATFSTLNGFHRPQALTPGTSVRIGPYRLDVETPPPGADLALTVELVQPLPGKSSLSASELQAQALRAPRAKRALSWALFLCILGAFLLLPALPSSGPSRSAPLPRLAQAAQAAWNPGELAAGHQAFAGQCRLCHSQSFTRVQDRDCQGCHRSVGAHAAPPAARATGLSEVRCASCHRDHNGATALRQQTQHFFMGECSACHGRLDARLPGTAIGNVRDFATAHPEFRVTVVTGVTAAAPPARARLRLGGPQPVREARGLKFPHDVHLAARGVKGPQGPVKLSCGSCHVPDGSGLGFQPVTMRQHCQSCHELRFEPAAPDRQLPHGNVDEVMKSLRDFYSYLALNGIVLNRPVPAPLAGGLPGRAASAPLRLTDGAAVQRQVEATATQLFEKTTCFVCHDIHRRPAADGRPAWQVARVVPAPAWLPQARFSHAAHALTACTTCHAAPRSGTAQDVLMPGIATCRGCHAGRQAVPGKLVSHCGLCHGFHTQAPAALPAAGRAPWPSARHAVPAPAQPPRPQP